jgi:hypothetical protein
VGGDHQERVSSALQRLAHMLAEALGARTVTSSYRFARERCAPAPEGRHGCSTRVSPCRKRVDGPSEAAESVYERTRRNIGVANLVPALSVAARAPSLNAQSWSRRRWARKARVCHVQVQAGFLNQGGPGFGSRIPDSPPCRCGSGVTS